VPERGQEVAACYEITRGDIYLDFVNSGRSACTFTVTDNSYGHSPQTFEVAPGGTLRRGLSLAASHSWYDFTVTCGTDPAFIRRFAGHVETRFPSLSNPTLSTGAVTATNASNNGGPVLFDQEGPECRLRCAGVDPSAAMSKASSSDSASPEVSWIDEIGWQDLATAV
jgi:hypothetical protein